MKQTELAYKLEVFEGPLDLLLSLIAKHKLNIYDIPISQLLDQYLAYMDAAQSQNMELSSAFIEMAARLVQIKSAMLLPTEEKGEELRQELSGELIEYQLCKQAAARLDALYRGNVYFVRDPAEVEIDMTYQRVHDSSVLYDAMQQAYVRQKRRMPPKSDRFSQIVERPVVSVTRRIVYIMKNLLKKGTYSFKTLFERRRQRPETVATFLALLELIRAGRVRIDEDDVISLVQKRKGRRK